MWRRSQTVLIHCFLIGLLCFSCAPRAPEPVKPSFPRDSLTPLSLSPILRLEAGMHTQRISQINVNEANRYLVTASNDNPARIWDMTSGQLLRTLRPPIRPDNEGKIFAVAISPNATTVACAGWTGRSWDGQFSIYFLNRVRGQLVHRISGLESSVATLTYSKDGRVLAATLHGSYGKNGIRLFRIKDYQLIAEHAQYGAESYGADFDHRGRLVTSSFDGFIRLYDPEFQIITKTNVEALTNSQQTPTTTKPQTIQDFPIAVTFGTGKT